MERKVVPNSSPVVIQWHLKGILNYHPKPLHLVMLAVLYVICTNVGILEQEQDLELSTKALTFLVHSSRCRIPHIEPNSSSVLRYFKPKRFKPCSRQPKLTYTRFSETKQRYYLYIRKPYLSCCYNNVERQQTGRLSDATVYLSDCIPFENGTLLPSHFENFMVQCFRYNTRIYFGAHALVPQRHEIQQRLNKWRNFESAHLPYNVLIIGVDSVSRLHYHRSLPRTAQYLTNSGWLELVGYNKMGDNTFPNLMAVLTGLSEEQAFNQCSPFEIQGLDNCSFIWKHFRDKGYVTAYSEDTPNIATFNYMKVGFEQQPVDYYPRPVILAAWQNLTASGDGRCLGEHLQSDLVYNYALDFLKRYRNNPFFGLFWTNSFSHDDFNQLSSMDDYMQNFFEQLNRLDILKNTVVIFMSDHGVRFGAARRTLSGFYEGRLPLFKIWLPNSLRSKYPDLVHNLEQNRFRLTSPFDLHMTLKHLLVLTEKETEKPKLEQALGCADCQSLFEPVPSERACHEAGIPEDYCACGIYRPMQLSDRNASLIAINAVAKMNRQVQKLDKLQQCRSLRLARVDAVYFQHEQNELPKYYIHFFTYPNQGLYEVIAKYNESDKTFPVKDITRLNSYWYDSFCVDNWHLKVYCSCANQLLKLFEN